MPSKQMFMVFVEFQHLFWSFIVWIVIIRHPNVISLSEGNDKQFDTIPWKGQTLKHTSFSSLSFLFILMNQTTEWLSQLPSFSSFLHTLIFIISFLLIFWFWSFLCHSFRQMTLRNHKYTQDHIIHSMSFILVSNEKPVCFDKNGQYDTFLCSESTKKHRVFLSFLCLCVCVC